MTAADLELALAERRPSVAARPSIVEAAAEISAGTPRVTLGRAWDIAGSFAAHIRKACPLVDEIAVAGETRRYSQLVKGLAVVARAPDPEAVLATIERMSELPGISVRTPRRIILTTNGHEIDLRVAPPDEFGTVLFTATGPALHVATVLGRRGTRLSATEPDVYEHGGLRYLPPELRDRPDALTLAAGQGELPLVSRSDILGDLHVHTNYSDGRDTLETMIGAAAALGYEYVAITDHSEHAAASRTITVDALSRQKDEIDALRGRFPDLTILQGIEVDILADGSLDCPDAVLSRLDIVLASLHEQHGHDRGRLTERCLQAIRHPLVSIITHPANQLVGHRAGYDMDYDRIYAEAAANGTILEIDGAPNHLDLDGDRAQAAVLAGVTVSIDSDCHKASALARQMALGVGTARRGGVTAVQVANTRPLAALRQLLARKRRPSC
jgi:DNA polymerase (family 10)